jgi:hypothetical protein
MPHLGKDGGDLMVWHHHWWHQVDLCVGQCSQQEHPYCLNGRQYKSVQQERLSLVFIISSVDFINSNFTTLLLLVHSFVVIITGSHDPCFNTDMCMFSAIIFRISSPP